MSCYVKIEDLSPEHKASILKDLDVVPEIKKGFKKEDYYKKEDESVQFYLRHTEKKADVNGKETEILVGVSLPYTYCACLLKKHINHLKSYPGINVSFSGNLYEKQKPVYDEVFSMMKTKGTSILKVPPGFGKTVLGTKIITDFKLKAVIVIHRELLIKQWLGTIKENTNAKVWVVGEPYVPDFDIILSMDQRIKNIPQDILSTIGLVVIDEAHSFCTDKRALSILSFRPKYILAETATPNPSNGMWKLISLMCGNKMVERNIEIKFDVIKFETGITHQQKTNKQGKLDWAFLTKQMVENPHRNQMIVDIVNSNLEKKILILTARTDHVNILKGILTHEKVDTFFGNKKSYKDSRVLIGTISKIGTGFDEKNACDDYNGVRIDLVILATSIKDESLLEQNVGRGFRSENPLIYDIVDKNSILTGHFYARQKWYLSKNGTVRIKKAGVQIEKDSESFISKNLKSLTQTDSEKKEMEEILKIL